MMNRLAASNADRHGRQAQIRLNMPKLDEQQIALMIATYIALDSFGTATNVTGDGAIAAVMGRLSRGRVSGDLSVDEGPHVQGV